MKKSVDRSTPVVSQTKGHARKQHPAEIAFDEARSAALGLTRAFGCESQGDIPAIDAVIMGRLSAALNSIDDALHTACFQRGLLPRIIGNSLRMACFLSQVLPMARAAQKQTGVPASILIAEAYEQSGPLFYCGAFELAHPEDHDIFNTGGRFDSIKSAFFARARWLSEDTAFQSIMRATGDRKIGLTSPEYPSNFVSLIAAWSKDKYGDDLVATISQHDLLACDRMVPLV